MSAREVPGEPSAHALPTASVEGQLTQRFSINFSYPVAFTRALFTVENLCLRETLARLEARRHRLFVIIDSGVAEAWPRIIAMIEGYAEAHQDVIELVTAPRVYPGGEAVKRSPALVRQLLTEVATLGLDRQSFILAVGGGALLDMVGFVAATAHRGIRLIRAPSTVLAQNDAGVGVKNGVNDFNSKNFLGTFAPPFAVLNDLDLIESLAARDKRAGIAEAIKVALIKDETFFWWLYNEREALGRFEAAPMAYMIRRCAELHLEHIATSGDPFEYGSARPLDFGHWAAHQLELMSDHSLRHGEAVAIGISLDSAYSQVIGRLKAEALEAIHTLIETLGFAGTHPLLEAQNAKGEWELWGGLEAFRQHLGGQLTVTLLEGIGDGVEVHEINQEALRAALQLIQRRFAGSH